MKANLVMNNKILNIIHEHYRAAAVLGANDEGLIASERLKILAKLYNGIWDQLKMHKDTISEEIIDSWMVVQIHQLLLKERELKTESFEPSLPVEVWDVIVNEIFKEIMEEAM